MLRVVGGGIQGGEDTCWDTERNLDGSLPFACATTERNALYEGCKLEPMCNILWLTTEIHFTRPSQPPFTSCQVLGFRKHQCPRSQPDDRFRGAFNKTRILMAGYGYAITMACCRVSFSEISYIF